MKVWLSLFCPWILLLPSANAEVGKKYERLLEYHDVVIRKIDPSGIRIMHREGVASIPVESLPPEIVAELGLNPEEADSYRQDSAAAAQDAARRQEEARYLKDNLMTIQGRILQVRQDGVLVRNVTVFTGKSREVKIPYTVRSGGPTGLHPDREYTLHERFKIEHVPETMEMDVVWVACDSSPYVDKMRFAMKAYAFAKYDFKDTEGVTHTVPSFTTRAEDIFEPAEIAGKNGKQGQSEAKGRSTGTGFFISSSGYMLTNYHVAGGRAKIEVIIDGESVPAKFIRGSADNDVALIKVERKISNWLALGSDAEVGLAKRVFTVGFPQTYVQGVSAKFTEGSVSALTGFYDDPRLFQISVPVQPGNSGGPLVDSSGAVVGIICSRLVDGLTEQGLAINQNVNYAVKARHAKELLEDLPQEPASGGPARTRESLVKSVADAVALILVE